MPRSWATFRCRREDMGGYKKDDRPRGARADVVYVSASCDEFTVVVGDSGTVVGPGSATHPIAVRTGRARRPPGLRPSPAARQGQGGFMQA